MNRVAPRFVWVLNKTAEQNAKIAKHVSHFFFKIINPRKSVIGCSRIFSYIEKEWNHIPGGTITVALIRPEHNSMTYQDRNAAGVNLSLCGSATACADSIYFPAAEHDFGISLTIGECVEAAWRICAKSNWTKLCITICGKIRSRVEKACVRCCRRSKKITESAAAKFFPLRL